MRKNQKQEVLNFINGLYQAHDEIKAALIKKDYGLTQNMLSECQEFAIGLGSSIEKMEGEGHISVSYVEEYCEGIFHVFERLSSADEKELNINKIYKQLNKQLLRVENSVKNDIVVKKEIAFFPYKASMWDSLESVYLAAKKDPNCDVYCVPIPYFDLKPDRSFGEMHYEGEKYPEYVEVTDWRQYHFEERKPDAIYIHNPYDDWNLVTSVHPRYYSSNLKKYTKILVYIPYYTTAGGMSEGQRLCSAYLNADYIVIQASKFRNYFDQGIPDKKFLPLGSPKFDRAIMKCQNPPIPSREWSKKMKGRKVYFYNTSISGMLNNTQDFLKKMAYVFHCFEGRTDVCLLWRPHPLLETTFKSMRQQYISIYEMLKNIFIEKSLGILDTTTDIEDAIALSDAYIGDDASSVVSLFGVVGKPVFILNNRIHAESGEESWRDEINISFSFLEPDRFIITQGNQLYISDPYKYDYRFFCKLSDHTYGTDYAVVYAISDKIYACPMDVQDILVIGNNGIEKKIKLSKKTDKSSAFHFAWKYEKYLLLIPLNYPAIVRYDTVTEEIKYYDDNIDVFIKTKNGRIMTGGSWVYRDSLYIGSPVDNKVYKLHIESGKSQIIELPIQSRCGCFALIGYKDEMWFLPYEGKTIVCWNPLTGGAREYTSHIKNFTCVNFLHGYECEEQPFGMSVFYGQYMYISPLYGNMYLQLNINTGEFAQWKPPFENEVENGEFLAGLKSSFVWRKPEETGADFKIYSYAKRKLYSINMETNNYKEIEIHFDVEELKSHEPGFSECSEQLRYACIENSFNTLPRFLDGNIAGNQFDKERQLSAYREIAANPDGSCGKRIHEFINKHM